MVEIDSCLEYIEWEGLQKPWEIDLIDPNTNIFKGSKKIEIIRDESYKIKATITGIPMDGDRKMILGKGEAGQIIPTFKITGSSDHKFINYILEGCILNGITYTTHNDEIHFEAPLLVNEVKQIYQNNAKLSWLTEWYLNGSKNIAYFPRLTERNSFLNFERLRNSIDQDLKKFKGGRSGKLARDFAFIDVGSLQFLITIVPKGLQPNWSTSLGIEYREDFGGIPDRIIRETISEIVSFFIGRQLLNIGYSSYTNTGEPIDHVAFSPWGNNVIHLCQIPDYPPCNFKPTDMKAFESTLSKATSIYLKIREDLQLKDVLWRYWIARNNPIDTNLPIFSSSVESLSNSWFKSKNSKTQGEYLPKKEFDKLLEKDFSQMEKKLESQEYKDRIINRMKNTYQMGANERIDFFFNEISLPLGDIEKKALKSRNKMAHGHLIETEKQKNEMIVTTESYSTLFHRLILKILGYSGNYIDRSSKGFPDRKIDETMLGTRLE
jgi:hypothetical protein